LTCEQTVCTHRSLREKVLCVCMLFLIMFFVCVIVAGHEGFRIRPYTCRVCACMRVCVCVCVDVKQVPGVCVSLSLSLFLARALSLCYIVYLHTYRQTSRQTDRQTDKCNACVVWLRRSRVCMYMLSLFLSLALSRCVCNIYVMWCAYKGVAHTRATAITSSSNQRNVA
jgi:hypothetical protein